MCVRVSLNMQETIKQDKEKENRVGVSAYIMACYSWSEVMYVTAMKLVNKALVRC